MGGHFIPKEVENVLDISSSERNQIEKNTTSKEILRELRISSITFLEGKRLIFGYDEMNYYFLSTEWSKKLFTIMIIC